MDELNVKSFELVDKASDLVNYHLLPDNKVLGPRFGADFPKVRAALANADAQEAATNIVAGLPVTIDLDGQTIELSAEEVLVQTEPLEGLAEAHDKLVTVAIDSRITPELRAEGLAREVVRRVQSMRKDAGFDIADRITTYYQAEEELSTAFATWEDYIKAETLSLKLVSGDPPEDAFTKSHKVDGQTLTLGVKKTS